MSHIIYKDESYKIIGLCMEVHNNLDKGFLEIVYEVKCISNMGKEHIAQTMNYLKISGCKLGLLVNFGKLSLEYKRIIL